MLLRNSGVDTRDDRRLLELDLVEFPGCDRDWLCFCDFHPHREDDLDFSSLAKPFKTEGFRHLVQLTSGRTTVEQLSTWFKIGKGTANLIIGYADEDIALVHDGKFTMDMSELDNGEGGSGGWA